MDTFLQKTKSLNNNLVCPKCYSLISMQESSIIDDIIDKKFRYYFNSLYSNISKFYKKIMTIINNIFILYDYFLYSTMHMFYKNKLNIDEIKQKIIINKNNSVSFEEINSKSKNIEFVQKYINLISFFKLVISVI